MWGLSQNTLDLLVLGIENGEPLNQLKLKTGGIPEGTLLRIINALSRYHPGILPPEKVAAYASQAHPGKRRTRNRKEWERLHRLQREQDATIEEMALMIGTIRTGYETGQPFIVDGSLTIPLLEEVVDASVVLEDFVSSVKVSLGKIPYLINVHVAYSDGRITISLSDYGNRKGNGGIYDAFITNNRPLHHHEKPRSHEFLSAYARVLEVQK